MAKVAKKTAPRKRQSADPVLSGADMVRRSLEAHDEPGPVKSFQAELSSYMSKLGVKGGKASGAKRMEMPAEQRKAIALKANRARWSKRKTS